MNPLSKWLFVPNRKRTISIKHTRCFNFQLSLENDQVRVLSLLKYPTDIVHSCKSKVWNDFDETMRKCSLIPVVVGVESQNWYIVVMWNRLTHFWLRTKVFSKGTILEIKFWCMTFRLSKIQTGNFGSIFLVSNRWLLYWSGEGFLIPKPIILTENENEKVYTDDGFLRFEARMKNFHFSKLNLVRSLQTFGLQTSTICSQWTSICFVLYCCCRTYRQ